MRSTYFTGLRSKAVVLVVLAIAVAVFYYLIRNFGIRHSLALMDSCISVALLAGGCMVVFNSLRYYRPKNLQYLYLLIWCAAITLVWYALMSYILSVFQPDESRYPEFLNKSMEIRYLIGFLCTVCAALLSVINFNIQDTKENDSRRETAEKLAKEAELYRLRQQLQPHFLFNSLNSISALAGSQPERARNMIQQLSDFLRGTIKKEDSQRVSLEDELNHLRLYLEIEKVRFGHRLNTEINCEEECFKLRLPPMLLQPVVENAIKFGLYDTIGEIVIRISARCTNRELQIDIENPFDPDTSLRHGTGFGLSSLQRRLYLLYARNDLLSTSAKDNTFKTSIKIPQNDQGYIN